MVEKVAVAAVGAVVVVAVVAAAAVFWLDFGTISIKKFMNRTDDRRNNIIMVVEISILASLCCVVLCCVVLCCVVCCVTLHYVTLHYVTFASSGSLLLSS